MENGFDPKQLIDTNAILDEYFQGLMDELPYDFRERVMSAQRVQSDRLATMEAARAHSRQLEADLDRLSEIDVYATTLMHAIADIVQKLIFLQVLVEAKRLGVNGKQEPAVIDVAPDRPEEESES